MYRPYVGSNVPRRASDRAAGPAWNASRSNRAAASRTVMSPACSPSAHANRVTRTSASIATPTVNRGSSAWKPSSMATSST